MGPILDQHATVGARNDDGTTADCGNDTEIVNPGLLVRLSN
jgi:hypothetical protein